MRNDKSQRHLVPIVSAMTFEDPVRKVTLTHPSDHLQIFSSHEFFVIKQPKRIIEVFSAFEATSRYDICDRNDTVVLYALEEADSCFRECYGSAVAFTFNIVDSKTEQGLVTLRSEIACFLQNIFIECPPGNAIGFSVKEFGFLCPAIEIRDIHGVPMYQIRSSFLGAFSPSGIKFKVKETSGATVAVIVKHFGSVISEEMSDRLSIQYLAALDNQVKAGLLAAVFHIAMIFNETILH